MAKITIPALADKSNVSESATNPFTSPDGLIDVAALAKLANRIKVANGKIPEDKMASGKVRLPKLVSPIFYVRKEIAKFSAPLDKKNDHKYKVLRGQQIKSRTRMPALDSKLKLVVILPAAMEGVDRTILADIKKATTAINVHNGKAVKVVDKVKTEKSKIRDAANKVFDKSVELLKAQLGNLKPTDIIEATGMMGKSVIVKVGPDNYIAVVKADKTRFLAAKKAAANPVTKLTVEVKKPAVAKRPAKIVLKKPVVKRPAAK